MTRDIFTGLSESIAVMGLSTENAEGAFTAFQQIASKGKLQAEELRGQLGERIPGAFGIAARAMNVTESELNKLLETGQVTSEEFLPKFARQLSTELSGGLATASTSLAATENRLKNAGQSLAVAFGSLNVPVLILGMDALVSVLDLAAENTGNFGKIALGLAIATIPTLITGIKLAAGALGILLPSFAATAAAAATFTVTAGLAFVAAGLFLELSKGFEDGGAKATAYAAQLSKIREELDKLRGKEPPKVAPDLPAENLIDRFILDPANENIKANRALRGEETTDENLIATYEDDAVRDLAKGVAKLKDEANLARDAGTKLIDSFKVNEGEIAVLKRLEEEITAIDNAKGAIIGNKDPNTLSDAQKSQLKALDEEVKPFIADRDATSKKVELAQRGSTDSTANLKGMIEFLDSPEALAKFRNPEALASFKKSLEDLLPGIEKTGLALNNLAKDNDPVGALRKRVTAVNTDFTKEQSKLKKFDDKVRGGFLQDRLKGRIDDDQLGLLNVEADKISAQENFKDTEDKLTGLRKAQKSTLFFKLSKDEQKQINDDVIKTEEELGTKRIEVAQKTLAQRKAVEAEMLDDLQRANAQAAAALDAAANERIGAVKRLQISGVLSEQDAATQIAAIQQSKTQATIANIEKQIAQNNKLKASGVRSADEAADKELELVGQLSAARLQAVDEELQARQDLNARILESLELVNQKAEAAVEDAQNSRLGAIKKARIGGVINEDTEAEDAGKVGQVERDLTRDRINLAKQEFKDISRLRSEGVIDENDATRRKIANQTELGALNKTLIDQEYEEQKRVQGEILRQLKQRLDLKQQELDLVGELLDAEQKLLDSRNNLSKALSGLGEAQGEGRLGNASRAVDIKKQLTEGDLGGLERQALREELASLGFDATAREIDLLKAQQVIEDQIANDKLKALKEEQFYQQQLLKLEQERNKLAAESALLTAEGALAEAEISGNQKLIGIRTRQVDLAQRTVDLQPQLADNAQRALDATQQTENIRFDTGERDRNREQGLNVSRTRGATSQDVRNARGDTSGIGANAPAFVDLGRFLSEQLGKGAVIDLPKGLSEGLLKQAPPPASLESLKLPERLLMQQPTVPVVLPRVPTPISSVATQALEQGDRTLVAEIKAGFERMQALNLVQENSQVNNYGGKPKEDTKNAQDEFFKMLSGAIDLAGRK